MKHFHHYIQLTLNKTNFKTDIAVLPMEANDILDTETDKYLIAKSVIDIAKECVRFGVKDIFIFSVTVNAPHSSTFISAVNNILQDKYAMHQFHFIDNLNIKKNTFGKKAFI